MWTVTPRGIAGEKNPPSRTKACRRRLPASARASLSLSAAPDARRWAPKARGRKTKRTLPRPEGPPPLGRASLHGWEPHLTRDGTPLPLAGSPPRGGFPLHSQGRSSLGEATRSALCPLGQAHPLSTPGRTGGAARAWPGAMRSIRVPRRRLRLRGVVRWRGAGATAGGAHRARGAGRGEAFKCRLFSYATLGSGG